MFQSQPFAGNALVTPGPLIPVLGPVGKYSTGVTRYFIFGVDDITPYMVNGFIMSRAEV